MRLSKPAKLTILGIAAVVLVVTAWLATNGGKRALSGSTASALVTIVHQRDLYSAVDTVRNVEDRFNHKYHYDWVILSEEDFSDQFKEILGAFASGTIHFRTINRKQDWKLPPNIDRNRLLEEMHRLDQNGVPDGGSNTFRIMSNFMSNAFINYLPEYRYIARIDPNIKLYCDMGDIFAQMQAKHTRFAFTMSSMATPHSTEELSETVNAFMKENKDILNERQWVDSFVEPWDSFCEFSTGFAVWDLDFFRSSAYQKWYQFVDRMGGIFYNRWSDSAIHTMAAALFLNPNEVDFLSDVGVYHGGRVNCPTNKPTRLANKCTCPFDPKLSKNERNDIFTYREQSCTPKFLKLKGSRFQTGWDLFSDPKIHDAYMD